MSGGGEGDVGAEETVNGVRVRVATSVSDAEYDCVVVVTGAGAAPPAELRDAVAAAEALDEGARREPCVVACARAAGGRLVLAPLGDVTPYHDVRVVGEAAARGVRRALLAGARRPLLALDAAGWERGALVAALGALEALYVPLQTREAWPEAGHRATALGVCGAGAAETARAALVLERGRALARDVGGADPERMAPPRVAEALRAAFSALPAVAVREVSERGALEREFPLLAAVSRAADSVPRHRARVLFLDYSPPASDTTVYLVGKGVTYDTGGCDVKTGGAMAGMCRDKCGAAAAAGFVLACALAAAPLRVRAALALVRNSVGEEAYVADEVVASRGGRAVLVGNTDAEGRLAMADPLEWAAREAEREAAAGRRRVHLYTLATLTGHAARAYGPYAALVDNAAARAARHADALAAAGEALGEGGEVSRLRREDFAAHSLPGGALLQAAPGPSTAHARGHQGPAAFLAAAAALDAAAAPPYTHVDVAGAAGEPPAPPTAAPLLTLAAYYKIV